MKRTEDDRRRALLPFPLFLFCREKEELIPHFFFPFPPSTDRQEQPQARIDKDGRVQVFFFFFPFCARRQAKSRSSTLEEFFFFSPWPSGGGRSKSGWSYPIDVRLSFLWCFPLLNRTGEEGIRVNNPPIDSSFLKENPFSPFFFPPR